MKISILGSKWELIERSLEEDKELKDADGYCDWATREIVVRKEIEGTLGNMGAYVRKVKRHEIVHAFLMESGLSHSANETQCWATNEEMVDWFARQGEKIYKAWKDANALGEDRP